MLYEVITEYQNHPGSGDIGETRHGGRPVPAWRHRATLGRGWYSVITSYSIHYTKLYEIYGSQSFDQAILDLYNAGRISEDKALEYATSSSDLKLRMEGLNTRNKSARPSDEDEREARRFSDEEIFTLKRD